MWRSELKCRVNKSIECSRNQTAELRARTVTLLPQCKEDSDRRRHAGETAALTALAGGCKRTKALLISLDLLPSRHHFFHTSARLLNMSAGAHVDCAASLWCINAHLRQWLLCSSALRWDRDRRAESSRWFHLMQQQSLRSPLLLHLLLLLLIISSGAGLPDVLNLRVAVCALGEEHTTRSALWCESAQLDGNETTANKRRWQNQMKSWCWLWWIVLLGSFLCSRTSSGWSRVKQDEVRIHRVFSQQKNTAQKLYDWWREWCHQPLLSSARIIWLFLLRRVSPFGCVWKW